MPLMLATLVLLMSLGMSAWVTSLCRALGPQLFKTAMPLPYLTSLLYAYNLVLHCVPLLYYAAVFSDAVQKNLHSRMLYHAVNILAVSMLVLLISLAVNALPLIKLLQRF